MNKPDKVIGAETTTAEMRPQNGYRTHIPTGMIRYHADGQITWEPTAIGKAIEELMKEKKP